MNIININSYIYTIKDVYVDVDKRSMLNTESGEAYAFKNPCDYKISSSDYTIGKY